jgi:hypothetical protein
MRSHQICPPGGGRKIVPAGDDASAPHDDAVPMNSANTYWPFGERGALKVRRWLSFMRVRPAI